MNENKDSSYKNYKKLHLLLLDLYSYLKLDKIRNVRYYYYKYIIIIL